MVKDITAATGQNDSLASTMGFKPTRTASITCSNELPLKLAMIAMKTNA